MGEDFVRRAGGKYQRTDYCMSRGHLKGRPASSRSSRAYNQLTLLNFSRFARESNLLAEETHTVWADVAGRAMKSHITTTAAAAAAGLLIRAVVRVGGSGSSGSGRSQILAARAIMLVLLLRMVSALRRATLGAPQNRLRSYVERHCVSFDPSRANRSRRSSKGEIALSTITEEECCHR